MYSYVDQKLVTPYKAVCEKKLREVQHSVRKRYKITMDIILIGSGAKKLITRNEREPFDLDYNMVLRKIPEAYLKDLGTLKAVIRKECDKVFKEDFSYGGDSVHAIRYRKTTNGKVVFRLDVGIHWIEAEQEMTKHLVRNKDNSGWHWEERGDSSNIKTKVEAIGKAGLRAKLEEIYLEKKNMYLKRQDDDHPSSVVYLEAVNEVFQLLKK